MVTATAMLLDSGPGCTAVTAIAGLGGEVQGGVSSPAAIRAVATASTVVLSAALLNSVAQSSAISGFDPENVRADGGIDFCAPVESVYEIGAVPAPSAFALAAITSLRFPGSLAGSRLAGHYRTVTVLRRIRCHEDDARCPAERAPALGD